MEGRQGSLMHAEDMPGEIPAMVLATDADGRVTFANTRLLSFIGSGASALIGRSILAVGAASLSRTARRAISAAMVADDERILRLAWNDGERGRRIVEAVFAPHRDPEGRPIGHIAIGMDVTASRRRDEHLAEARRMDAIRRLAGGIAHAINNALTVVMGSADIATQRLRHGESPAAELGEILQAGRKAAALIRQLQAAGGRGQEPAAPLDLSRLAESLVPTLDRILGAGVVLETALQDEPWPVRADAAQMEQVLMSLAANARDAMPDGGRLSISIANRPALTRAEAPCGWDAGRDHVLLRVRDTGQGMDAATLGQIYEPFFTTKKAAGSTGMGLAAVYGIVRQSGGCIEVDSAPGRGTEFRIRIPRLLERAAAASAPDEAAVPAPQGRSERVLVVEDDASLLDTISSALGGHGYRVSAATTAEHALKIVASGGPRFDLLLADLILPGMTGVELRDRLRAVDPALKVLMMSGCREDAVRGLTTLLHDGAFLRKPFGTATLLGRVRETLDGGRTAACA